MDHKRYTVSNKYVLRELAGGHIIVPIGEGVADFCGVIGINPTGVFLWKRLMDSATVEQMLGDLLESYDITEEAARQDIKDFLEILRNHHILQETS